MVQIRTIHLANSDKISINFQLVATLHMKAVVSICSVQNSNLFLS